MPDNIRRCRQRQAPDCDHAVDRAIDAYDLVRVLHRNHLLVLDVGLVSYRLASQILQEPALDAAVDAGSAAMLIDPETGQRLYVVAGG